MKTVKNIVLGVLFVVCVMPMLTSCNKDFLKEELTTSRNTDFFNTNEGIESLATGIYDYLRFYICSEAGYSLMNYGTDEYSVGADNSNGMWNDYGADLNPSGGTVNTNTVYPQTLWDYMYTGINAANILIDRIDKEVYTGSKKNIVAGTAHFIRAFHYYNLLTQYGGVPLKLEPSTEVSFEFERASKSDVFDQIEKDFLAAYSELPATASKVGEITKDAAAHFLAKSYLWRASELNDDWNSTKKTSDLDNVIRYADEVIKNHPLADNFKDLWDYKVPDGANETLPEVVLAAQFTGPETTTWNVGGCLYFYTCSQYRDLPGMFRDVPGGREYNRLRTTYYSIYSYDLVNDSRVWKTFRTKMYMNSPKNASAAGFEAGKNLGLMYIFNQPGDERFGEGVRHNAALNNILTDAETGLNVGTTFVFYPKGTKAEDTPMELTANNDAFKYFPMNTKYVDGSRESISDSHCFRDGIIARSAEDYFLAAEAYLRQGNYGKATEYLNKVRARAAWKKGEDRGEHVDGGQAWDGKTGAEADGISSYVPRNSYYQSNNLPVKSLDAQESSLELTKSIEKIENLPTADQAIVQKLGLTSEKDVALCFLLNEKSREMSLELVRWVDLARTKTLISRVKAFNREGAANIADKHYLRPIPQSYINTLQREGKALTTEEKKAMQNPGY